MLIQPRKNAALESIYSAYARRLIRRQFGHVRMSGHEFPETDQPVIAYMNHTAWWDAVVPVHLSHDLFRREIHALMEAEQLRRYPFFRHLGCFGADDGGLADARAVVEHSSNVLRTGNRPVLWIFPQGSILPSRAPMKFKSGLARIAGEVPDALVIPMAVRYEFLKRDRPECRVRIGEPAMRTEEDHFRFTRRLESLLQAEIDALDSEIARDLAL
ncbi:MAG: lysophospholipid acyltransferase family protein [Gemmatimonadaceae bacterium]